MDFIPSGKIELSREDFFGLPDKAKKCFPIFEKYFGKEFTEKNFQRLKNKIINFCVDSKVKNPTLKESKDKLKKIHKVAGQLHDELEDLGLGGPVNKAIDESFRHFASKHPEFEKGLPEGDLPDNLLYLKILTQKALDNLPTSSRWPKEFKAEKELIIDLAKIFEEATQTHPLDSIYRFSIREKSDVAVLKGQKLNYYTGDFFNLVDDITLTLGSRDADNQDEFKANQSLGMAIKRALERD